MKALNERLIEVQGAKLEQRRLQGLLASARNSLEGERARLAELEAQLAKEDQDVKQLEGLSLAGLFYTVLGSKEDQLREERQQVLAARLKFQQARYAVSALEREIEDLERQLASLGDVDLQYDSVLRQKEQLLLQEQGEASRRLLDLSSDIAQARAETREIEEAFVAGRLALHGLSRVIESLRSASSWGTWDVLGGGILVTAVKHSRLDDASDEAQKVQSLLERFRRELADVDRFVDDAVLELDSFERFADFFIDGLIVDWVIQSRINQSLEYTIQMHNTLRRIQDSLKSRLETAGARIGTLEAEKQQLLENTSRTR